VAKGLRRMSVELDNAALAALAGGDQALVLELLQELHVVYQHWISQEAKRQRRARNRRVQSQGQQNGYARAGAAAGDASEKRDAEKRDAAERRHAADRPKVRVGRQELETKSFRPPGKRRASVVAKAFHQPPVLGLLRSGLADVAALMSQRSGAHGPAVSVMVSCCGDSLLQLTSQYLKQTVRGEQEYLAAAHHILRAMLSQKDLAEACHEQGVPSHFLARSLQRLGDERSTAGTLQAAALLATDLWLAGVSTSSPQEGLGDLLSALKTATQSRQGRCPHMVAFSCLARLLSRLCDNQDVEGTPAVYRTFVYALVECESHSSREFGTRCLLNLLEKYEGVPVGILAELSVKKFQVSAAEPLTVIDIELFLVIAKHPRCTDRHAELLAQVLVRCALENPDVGRAASLPLLVIFRRFAREDSLQALFEHFVQADPTRDSEDAGQSGAKFNPQHDFVATISHLCCVCAYLGVPSLDRRMRRLLQEVCKAYLSSYIELHPNLQAVLQHYSQSATCDAVAHIGASKHGAFLNAKDSLVDRLSSEMLLSKREVAAFRPDEGLILTVTLAITGGVKRFENPDPNPLRNASAPWPVGHGRGSGVVISLLETHSAVTEEVKSEIHELFSGVAAQSLSNVRHFDSYLSSLATALISLSEKVRGPYLQSPLSEILKVIDKTLKPGILDQHAAAQQAITRADQTVMRCYNTLWRSLNQSDVILHSLAEKRQAIKSCYSSAAADSAGVATALLSLPRLLTARASDCENLLAASNAREAPLQAWAASCDRHDGSSVGTYLMKQLMHWEDLLQHYDDIEKRCKESTASYETQVLRRSAEECHQHDGADCRPLQVDMDEAACQQALDRIESCGTYGSCIKARLPARARAGMTALHPCSHLQT
ncbi:SmE, partial [Symbiodinium necroappetens]